SAVNDRRLRGGIATSFQQDLRSCQISVHYPGKPQSIIRVLVLVRVDHADVLCSAEAHMD
ncbi:hypothetical protein, partial [Nocardia sp. NPDC051570]|uniref:hypothetical protein n=1 Tax=Nocardia sp. NPDC051570 TaxID=3364324 RepID=UPI0037BC0298